MNRVSMYDTSVQSEKEAFCASSVYQSAWFMAFFGGGDSFSVFECWNEEPNADHQLQ